MSRLVIIDGNSLIHRAFHALPPLSTPTGEQVNAVYGFTSMLIKVLSELKPTYLVVAFDVPKPTFRHSLYPLYKAHRPPVKVEMEPQFAKVKLVVEAFGIPIFEKAGYEADDIIGTLARQGEENPKVSDVLIVTGDLDTLQLIDKKTSVFTTRKGITDTVTYSEKEVIERYGLKPSQVVDYKALRGDTSDEIPGVAGIGEKTASELLNNFGTLENLYNNLDQVKDKTRVLLENNYETAMLSKKLAQIDTDVPVNLDLNFALVKNWEQGKIVELFNSFGFRSLVKRLFGDDTSQDSLFSNLSEAPITSNVKKSRYHLVEDPVELKNLLNSKIKELAFDTETTSLKPYEAELVGFSFALKEGEAYYVPIANREASSAPYRMVQGSAFVPYTKQVLPIIKEILENPDILKIGHNLKYDMAVMSGLGFTMVGPYFDTMIASYLLNPGSRSLGLKNVAYTELGIMMTEITELIGTGKKQINMKDVPVDKVKDYAAADADIALRLKNSLVKKLKENDLIKIFEDIEMPLIKILYDMELRGIEIDTKILSRMSNELGKTLTDIERLIYESVGHEFNINSTKQLSEVLFSELNLPAVVKTKTGYSTDESVLQSLKNAHPVVEYLLNYRELFKLKSTYIDALPNLISSKDNRLHSNFNQAVAATGRLSSNEPNLQNIPAGDGYGGQVRKAFVSKGGCILLSADYSQIELRIMAHYTQDEKLLEAFEKGQDVHATVASQVFKVPLEKVTKDQRRMAKTINFGLMYGQGAHGLAQQLSIGRNEASMFINQYFLNFSQVRMFLESLKEDARAKGYVTTMLGRKRFFANDINSSIPTVRSAAERAAINFPFQGTAADIIKVAMINIDHRFKELQIDQPMILQVHDELVFEIIEGEVERIVPIVKNEMENALKLSVPLEVDLKKGKNWYDMKKI